MAKEENINAILEGCNHDSPSRLQYCPVEVYVPEKIPLIKIRKVKLPRIITMSKIKASENLCPRGWNLSQNNDNIDWIFEMPRSLTTRDGRMYVNEIFSKKGWEYYFPVIPTILKDCRDFFTGRINSDELYNLTKRAF